MQRNQIFQNPLACYKNLQKQLNDQHARLLKQREQMLSKENQRLQLYEKLDLVEFFNYSPIKNESKQKMMYHLSQKFKNYMRKLTQNNVYKRQSHLINHKNSQQHNNLPKRELFTSRTHKEEHESRQKNKERSCSSRKSNVERNSDLGRMFQTMRHYQQQNHSENYPRQNQSEKLKNTTNYIQNSFPQNHNYAQPFSVQQKQMDQVSSHLNEQHVNQKQLSFQNPFQEKSNKFLNSQPQKQIALQIEQLRSALAQQQKIYLLTQLNHYIKLFKQSEIKRNFQQKHLENLHQFILSIKQKNFQKNQRSKSKSKSKYQTDSYEIYTSKEKYLEEENKMLKIQLQIYQNQLKIINKFSNEDLALTQVNKFDNYQHPKCVQAKKIDRFKEFAEHIKIMQTQLNNLVVKINAKNFMNPSQNNAGEQIINQLKDKITTLQNTIQLQEMKKLQFFQQVKKFKQVMNIKNQEVTTLKTKLFKYQTLMNKLEKQNEDMLCQRNKYKVFQVKCQLKEKEDISQFINRTLNSPQRPIFDEKSFRNSAVTTNSPSAFQSRNSRVQSNSSNYRNQRTFNQKSQWNQNNRNKYLYDDIEQTNYKRMNYHERNSIQSKQTKKSRSKSKYSLRSDSKDSYISKSKTDFFDSYEPKPYERYNKLSDYQIYYNVNSQTKLDVNPLYQRINDKN